MMGAFAKMWSAAREIQSNARSAYVLTEEREAELRRAIDAGPFIQYHGVTESEFLASEFTRLQAERRKGRLTAAKGEVQRALFDVGAFGAKKGANRFSEIAADAIENLIHVVMEDVK